MNTQTTPAPAAQAEIIDPGTGPDLEIMERGDALAIWNGFRSDLEKLKSSVEGVLTADPELPSSAKLARVNRLELRQIRIAVENKRKELGENLLRKKQGIDSAAKELKELIEPYEQKLLEIEQHAERVEAERLRKLTADRIEAISKFTTVSSAIDYGAMPEQEFDRLLADAKAIHELRAAESKRIEEARIANEKAQAEERERIRLENEQLKKEAAEREATAKAEREKAEAARVAAETKAREEREAIEAKARAEREEIERKAKAEREAAEAIAAQERAAREKIEAEKRQREAKEAKAKADAAKAEKKAAAAPDKHKLSVLAGGIRKTFLPEFKTEEGNAIATQIRAKIEALATWIEAQAAEI